MQENINNESINIIEQLKNEILELQNSINQEIEGSSIYFTAKKKLYTLKIRLIDLIATVKKKTGTSARDFFKQVDSQKPKPKYATGIRKIDDNLDGGIEAGSFVQLAGASFSGKSTLMAQIICNIAEGNKAVFFNFEMSKRMLRNRLRPMLDTNNKLDNFIIDSDSYVLSDLEIEIKYWASNSNVNFFVIDSKMKIFTGKIGLENDELISSTLARLTQQLDIIIILINQMSNEAQKEKTLALRGSNLQGYDSDLLFFLQVDKEKNRQLICGKNRQNSKEFKEDLSLQDITGKAPITITYQMQDEKKLDEMMDF